LRKEEITFRESDPDSFFHTYGIILDLDGNGLRVLKEGSARD